MAKSTCWQHKHCGREPGGNRVAELGICPAAVEGRLDGTHGGVAAGRACWVVAGTFCGGKVQGSFAQKVTNCLQCEFYQAVRSQEGPSYLSAHELLSRLH